MRVVETRIAVLVEPQALAQPPVPLIRPEPIRPEPVEPADDKPKLTAEEREDYISWQWAREERGSKVPKSDPAAEDVSNAVDVRALSRGSPKAAQDLARRSEQEAKRREAHHASLRASEDVNTGTACLRHFLGGQNLVPVGSAHEDDRDWILGCSPPQSPPRSPGSRKLIGRLSRSLSPSEARLLGVEPVPLLGTPATHGAAVLPAGARPNAMLKPGTVLGQRLMAPDTSLTRLSRVPSPPATTTVGRRARPSATSLATEAPRSGGASTSPTAEVSSSKRAEAALEQQRRQSPQSPQPQSPQPQSPQRRGPRRAKQEPALCSSLRHASWTPSPPPLSPPPRSPAAPSSPSRSHAASPTTPSPLPRATSLPRLCPSPTRPKLLLQQRQQLEREHLQQLLRQQEELQLLQRQQQQQQQQHRQQPRDKQQQHEQTRLMQQREEELKQLSLLLQSMQPRTPSPAPSPQPSSPTGGHVRSSRSSSPGPLSLGVSPDLDGGDEDAYGAAEVHRELDLFERRNSPKRRRAVPIRAQ